MNSTVFGILLGALLIGLFTAAWMWDAKACEAQGGTLRSFTGFGPAISAQGGVAFTTTTMCVSADGRIL